MLNNIKRTIGSAFTRFYLEFYVHLSLCVMGLTAFTYAGPGYKIDLYYIIFVGVSCFVYYNLHQLLVKIKLSTRHFYNQNEIKILSFLLIPAIGALSYFMWFFDYSRIKLLLPAFILAGVYLLPVFLDGRRFRDVPYIKIIIISLVFTFLTATVPMYEKGMTISDLVGTGFARFCFIAALCIAFDIGDLLSDRKANTQTIPTALGLKISKITGTILLLTAFCFEFYYAWNFVIDIIGIFCAGIVYFISTILLWKSLPTKSKYYYLFFVDGMMGLMWILFIFLS